MWNGTNGASIRWTRWSSGPSKYTARQVMLINDRPYWTTWALAQRVARMSNRKRKTWFGRNWRRCLPLIETQPGFFRLKSGTHD